MLLIKSWKCNFHCTERIIYLLCCRCCGRCRRCAWRCRRIPTRQHHHQATVTHNWTAASSYVLPGDRLSGNDVDVCCTVWYGTAFWCVVSPTDRHVSSRKYYLCLFVTWLSCVCIRANLSGYYGRQWKTRWALGYKNINVKKTVVL